MATSVGESRRIEWTDLLANFWQLQQARTRWNQQANRKLDRRDVLNQIQSHYSLKHFTVIAQGGPGRESHEGGGQRQAGFWGEGHGLEEIGARVALVEQIEQAIVYRFDRRGDEQASSVFQARQQAAMFQQVLDLDGHVVSQCGKLRMHGAQDGHGVGWTVEEIRVAEGDVLGSHRHLLADVGQHYIPLHDAERAVIHGDYGAMPA